MFHFLDSALSKLFFALVLKEGCVNYQANYIQLILQDRWRDNTTEPTLLVEGNKLLLHAFQLIILIQTEHSLIRNTSRRALLCFILQSKHEKGINSADQPEDCY